MTTPPSALSPTGTAASIAQNDSIEIVLRRWISFWLDLLLLKGLLFAPGYIFGPQRYKKIPIIGIRLFCCLLYFRIMEACRGKPPGKLIACIRVVKRNGQKPSWTQSIVRNLIRLIEINPFFGGGLIAGIITARSRRKQRLGDMLARTYVLRDEGVKTLLSARSVSPASSVCPSSEPSRS